MTVNTVLFIFSLLLFFPYKKDKEQYLILINWVIFTILIIVLNLFQPRYIFLYLLLYKKTRIPLITILLIFMYLIGGGYTFFRLASIFLFKLNLDLNVYNTFPSTPTIIMANYPANQAEYLVQGLFGNKVCLVATEKACSFLKFFHGKDTLIAIKKGKNNFDEIQKIVKKKLQQGYHIFCYIEKEFYKRKNIYSTTELRAGMFSIAKNIGCTITPIVVDHISHFRGIIDNFNFKIYIDKTRYVDDVQKEVTEVTQLYKNKLRKFSFK